MEKFSWWYVMLNVALVGVGAVIAFFEHRLTKDQMGIVMPNMPWTCHGGMWTDLFLVSILMGIMLPYWHHWSSKWIVICLAISLVVTIACHILWATMQPIPGHIVDSSGKGLGKLPVGGWYHVVYMTFSLAVILLFYLATPNPAGSHLLIVSLLLTIFVFPAIMQPGIYVQEIISGEGKVDVAGWVTSIVIWATVWITYYCRTAA